MTPVLCRQLRNIQIRKTEQFYRLLVGSSLSDLGLGSLIIPIAMFVGGSGTDKSALTISETPLSGIAFIFLHFQ